MQIVALSDLHGYLPENLPKGDVLCICGDIVPLEVQTNNTGSREWLQTQFGPWTERLPHKKVIMIAGNHDFYFYRMYGILSSKEIVNSIEEGYAASNKLVYLCDESYEYEGITFYGTPWIQDLWGWGFYLPNDQLAKKWQNIPENIDILLTHQPSSLKDTGTVLEQDKCRTGSQFGSKSLGTELLKRQNLKYALCGHVHSGNHELNLLETGCQIANVSLVNEQYQIAYSPLTFKI